MSKSRISVEATELDEDEQDWTEAGIFIEREGEPDEDLRSQQLLATRAELAAIYARLKMYFEQGIWSIGSVER